MKKLCQTKFSVLISTYKNDNPLFLDEALESIWSQSLPPNEVVIVQDGKLPKSLEDIISKWKKRLTGKLKIVKLNSNVGLGLALQAGVVQCSYEHIARMDSDDISTPERFEKQVSFMENNPEIDLCGCQIREFHQNLLDTKIYRSLPTDHKEIIDFSKKRNPFNHMTVMFKKQAVIEAGNYNNHYLYEDYLLWAKMLINGAQTANISYIGVYARAGNEMYARRGGLAYAKSEIDAQIEFYRIGFISLRELLRNITYRTPIRLLPNSLRGILYKKILRS